MNTYSPHKQHSISLSDELIGQRIDVALASILIEIPRTKIQSAIKKGNVYRERDGKILSNPSERIKSADTVIIELPEEDKIILKSDSDIPLDIVFENENFIVLNKQAGLTVHPGAGQKDRTLVNAILHHTGGKLSNLSGDDRLGILHRLDKDTTGLMVIAKNNDTHANLAEQIKKRDMKRAYQALVWGTPSPRQGTIETFIARDEKNRTKMAVVTENGKIAITHYTVIKPLGLHNSLIECRLDTGRTHQIRLHMLHLGYPIVGDRTYRLKHTQMMSLLSKAVQEKISSITRQALHAYKLDFKDPNTGENLSFTYPIPNDMQEIIDLL